MSLDAINPDDRELVETLDKYTELLNFVKTDQLAMLINLPHKIIAMFSGNRAGKTASVAEQYVRRVLGIHPIPRKNLLAKKIRCLSDSLPEPGGSPEEQDNAQYLELKRLIPDELIVSDITERSRNLVVRRPPGLNSKNTIFEFRSIGQDLQKLGKINLSSVWYDEESPAAFREECKMRLIQEGGDEIFSLTATNSLSYTYDDIWLRAELIYRTKAVADFTGEPQLEHTGRKTGIACIQMATDDNPTLDPEFIETEFADFTDKDALALRRYGVFRQVSGRVHKTYKPGVCYISFNKYFPDGIPYKWVHARGIDYHESRIPWSVGWLSASPEDEWFLWQEFHPAIDGPNAYNTYEISSAIARKSGDYYYTINLIDALAKKKQANSLFSTVDDLNRYFAEIRENRGLGTETFWKAWNTKGTTGRDEVSKRFKNAVRCGRPFNNLIKDKGRTRRLPTLWICDTCPKFHKSIMDWRFGEHVAARTKALNDPNPKPQQKNSHDNMVLECLAKDPMLVHASHLMMNPPRQESRRRTSITGR